MVLGGVVPTRLRVRVAVALASVFVRVAVYAARRGSACAVMPRAMLVSVRFAVMLVRVIACHRISPFPREMPRLSRGRRKWGVRRSRWRGLEGVPRKASGF